MMSRQKDKKTKRQKRQKRQKDKKTKRQKDKKYEKKKRQGPRREFNIVTSEQFCTLAMFFMFKIFFGPIRTCCPSKIV